MKKPIVKSLFFGALFLLTTFAHAAPKTPEPFVSDPCQLDDVTVGDNINASDCRGSLEGNDSGNFGVDINGIFGETNPDITWIEAEGSLTAELEEISGNWTYTGTEALSSPFVIVLKGSKEYSAYLFKGLEDLYNGDGGLFSMSILTNNDNKNIVELSHISLYTTDSDIPGTSIFGNPVPLPAALWLFGPALLGFMGFRRKNKS